MYPTFSNHVQVGYNYINFITVIVNEDFDSDTGNTKENSFEFLLQFGVLVQHYNWCMDSADMSSDNTSYLLDDKPPIDESSGSYKGIN